VPFVDVERHFDGASIFVNTSSGEGFPNTFLQAWSRAIPTVSFFDAGASVAGQPVGVVVPDTAAMVAAVQQLKGSPSLWAETGERARACFESRHSADRITEAYEQLLVDAMGRRRGNPSRLAQPAKS
jgi:glycosyltransferase involved in cell wall biosynthesis